IKVLSDIYINCTCCSDQRNCATFFILICKFPCRNTQWIIKFGKLACNGYNTGKVIFVFQLLGGLFGINIFMCQTIFSAMPKIIDNYCPYLEGIFDCLINLWITVSTRRCFLLVGIRMDFFYVNKWLFLRNLIAKSIQLFLQSSFACFVNIIRNKNKISSPVAIGTFRG